MRKRKGKMLPEPKVYFSPRVENRGGTVMTVLLPPELVELIKHANTIERGQTGLKINSTEFAVRAIIDRIGRILGTRFASRLYRAYFNGIGQIKPDIDFPAERNEHGLNIFITEKKNGN